MFTLRVLAFLLLSQAYIAFGFSSLPHNKTILTLPKVSSSDISPQPDINPAAFVFILEQNSLFNGEVCIPGVSLLTCIQIGTQAVLATFAADGFIPNDLGLVGRAVAPNTSVQVSPQWASIKATAPDDTWSLMANATSVHGITHDIQFLHSSSGFSGLRATQTTTASKQRRQTIDLAESAVDSSIVMTYFFADEDEASWNDQQFSLLATQQNYAAFAADFIVGNEADVICLVFFSSAATATAGVLTTGLGDEAVELTFAATLAFLQECNSFLAG